MAKTYYLYLDESGDFDSDLRKKYRNECLVGGILYEIGDPMSEEKARNIIVRAWLQENPEDRRITNTDAVLRKSRHATELEAEKKASLTANVISETSKSAQIVVFENYEKTQIGDSVKTYINILVDGVVQLLKRLSVDDEKVTLKVVAGFKKDTRKEITSSMYEGYIDKQECVDMFNERFALMRAKNSGNLRYPRMTFDYADDKRTCQLILCDYICNFRFTRNKPIYSEMFTKDKTYGEFIGSFYDEDNIFSIKGGTQDEKVENYLIEGGYALALFDICSGVITGKKRCERVLKKVAELSDPDRDVVLDSLKNYIHNIVSDHYKLSQAEEVVAGAEEIVSWFEAREIPVSRFKLDVLLYKLTVLDHAGRLEEMAGLWNDCENALRNEISAVIEYASMINGQAPVLIPEGDDREYRIEAYDISNFNGLDTVGAMVVYEGRKPVRSDYRKFKVRTAEGDDYGSLREVIYRRLKRARKGDEGFSTYPDIMFIDGGLGQVHAVKAVVDAFRIAIPVVGLAKDDAHRTRAIVFDDGREIELKGNRLLFSYCGNIQEEVHRFAITYMSGVKGKKMIRSVLEDIPGIGPKRRAMLLEHFGSIDAIRKASYEDLMSLDGMNSKAAESVMGFFAERNNEEQAESPEQ